MSRILSALIGVLALVAGGAAMVLVPAQATEGGDTPGQCVPQDGWTETIVVIDKEAYDEMVFDHWQRYSWTGGPHESDDPPAFPSDDWQPNVEGDPHGVGVAGAYFRSHGNSGKGDWFYLEAVTKLIHHPAETHEEVIEHPAIDCPPTDTPTTEVPTDPTDPTDPPTTETPDPCKGRPVVGGPCAPVEHIKDPPTVIEFGYPSKKAPVEDAPLPDTGA